MEAQNLTEEDINLLQITALFHDSAREGDDADKWDDESALLLFYYLTNVKGIDPKKAKLFAEAIANKDMGDDQHHEYHELVEENGDWVWKVTAERKKNIFQKIMHDADCIDIIRARDHFDGTYLDFYKDIAKDNPQAFDELGLLIIDVRSLIEKEGDARRKIINEIKKRYEHAGAYSAIVKDIEQKPDSILSFLFANGHLLKDQLTKPLLDPTKYDPKNGLSEKNVQAAVREGRVLARSVAAPSAGQLKDANETLIEVEIRKTYRTPTVLTKKNKLGKDGNVNRSTSLIGWGASVYASQGYLIIDSDPKDIVEISSIDSDSSRGKKRDLSKNREQNVANLSAEEKIKRLAELQKKQKLGGDSKRVVSRNYIDIQNEVITDIHDFNAIYFSRDPNCYNFIEHNDYYSNHYHSPELQAFFIQQEHLRLTEKKLPIFDYNATDGTIKLVPDYTEDQIVSMWATMCEDYIKKKLSEGCYKIIATSSLDNIKIGSMYGDVCQRHLMEKYYAADKNMNAQLQAKINAAIEEERKELLKDYLTEITHLAKSDDITFTSDELFFGLLNLPALREGCKDKIKMELKTCLANTEFIKNLQREIGCSLDFEREIYNEKYKKGGIGFLQGKKIDLEDAEIEKIYFSPVSVKFYYLSLMADDNENREKILDTIKEVMNESLSDMIKAKYYQDISFNLQRLGDLISYFGLQNDYSKKINQLIISNLEQSCNQLAFKDFGLILDKVFEKGLMNDELAKETKRLMEVLKNKAADDLATVHKTTTYVNQLNETLKRGVNDDEAKNYKEIFCRVVTEVLQENMAQGDYLAVKTIIKAYLNEATWTDMADKKLLAYVSDLNHLLEKNSAIDASTHEDNNKKIQQITKSMEDENRYKSSENGRSFITTLFFSISYTDPGAELALFAKVSNRFFSENLINKKLLDSLFIDFQLKYESDRNLNVADKRQKECQEVIEKVNQNIQSPRESIATHTKRFTEHFKVNQSTFARPFSIAASVANEVAKRNNVNENNNNYEVQNRSECRLG